MAIAMPRLGEASLIPVLRFALTDVDKESPDRAVVDAAIVCSRPLG